MFLSHCINGLKFFYLTMWTKFLFNGEHQEFKRTPLKRFGQELSVDISNLELDIYKIQSEQEAYISHETPFGTFI